MKKLPIGIQSFEEIRNNNYYYIDKTKYIWNLIHTGKVYFLSRPRRFGKSLLLSTMKAYFEGEKELFSGLEIEKHENESEKSWIKYPIIHMSFAMGNYSVEGELELKLNSILRESASEYGVIDNPDDSFGDRLFFLIKNIKEKTGKNVVILIDEYDKPLLENLASNETLEDKNRNTLKGFYGTLKEADENLKFVFITGVTKFSKVSIFSDLNQLNDISFDIEYAGICGITEEELEHNLPEEINALANEYDYSHEECLQELKQNYNGYHFSSGKIGVYNPFSILNCFSKRNFDRYWFSTGTPTFLINLLEKSGRPIADLTEGVSATKDRLDNYRADSNDFIPLFYQAGYLTIVGYDKKFKSYKLAFPNNEVQYGFLECLIPLSSPKYEAPDNGFSAERMTGYLENRDLESFMTMIRALLASIPYYEGEAPSNEQQWRNILYAIFTILGQYVRAEVHSSRGRSDCIVETDKYIYIFEFKQDKSADEALAQIEDKGYAVPYISSGKEIIKIGANFSSKEQTLDSWKVK